MRKGAQKKRVPRERKGRKMHGCRVGSSEGQAAAQRAAVRPLRLLMAPAEQLSRSSAPPGTNLHVLSLTAVGRVSREPLRATPSQEEGPSPWEPHPP